MPKKTPTTPNVPLVSPIAELARKPRDVKDQKLPAVRIVVHITGVATYVNAAKAGTPPLDRLEEYFDAAGNPFAHYAVDPWGRIRCFAPENETPWAQGWGGLGGREKLLADLKAPDDGCGVPKRWTPPWWREAHHSNMQELRYLNNASREAFIELFPEGTPNDRSVAVEFVQWQPPKGKNYKLTTAQYLAGNMLLHDIALRHGIEWPASADERAPAFLGHEDCNPWERGTPAGGWDPGSLRESPRFCWDCMLFLRDLNGCKCVIKTPEMPEWAR